MHRGSAHSLFHGSHLRVSRLCLEGWQGYGRVRPDSAETFASAV